MNIVTWPQDEVGRSFCCLRGTPGERNKLPPCPPVPAFGITLLMVLFSLKLHILETANVFFPFLRKQPNPSPIMFVQPKDTSPLAGERRNAQICAVQTSQAEDRSTSDPPLTHSTNTFETQT